MDLEQYILVGLLTLGLVLGISFRLNPVSLWTDLIEHFSRGPDKASMRSRMDRQGDKIAVVCFLVFIGIPAAILLWLTYAH